MAGIMSSVGGGFAVGVAITAKDLYSRAFAKAKTDLQQLRKFSETEAAKLERSLNVGRTLTQAGAVITGASLLIDRAFSDMTRSSAQFSQKLANVSTLLETKGVDAPEEFRKSLKKNIYDASRETGLSIMQLGDSAYELISGIEDADEALAAIPYSAKLARAAMGTTDSAVEVLTNSLNTFAKSWDMSGEEKAERVSQMYAKTVALAKTNLDKMADSMSYAGAAGIQFGQDMETVLAAVGTLQSAGLDASMAGTSFRNMFNQLLKNKDAFKSIGVDVVDAQGNFNDLGVILDQLNKATEGMTESEIGEFFQKEIGIRGSSAAVLLTQNFDAFSTILEANRNDADALGTMLAEALKGGEVQMDALRAASERMKTELAEKLLPAQIAVQKVFMDIGEGILESPILGEVAKWGVAVLGLGAKIGKILGPAMTMVGMLKQMRAMKKITLALENKGVAESAGKGIGGAFGKYLAGAAIAIGAATIAYAIINKVVERKEEAARAEVTEALTTGSAEEAQQAIRAIQKAESGAGGRSFESGPGGLFTKEFWSINMRTFFSAAGRAANTEATNMAENIQNAYELTNRETEKLAEHYSEVMVGKQVEAKERIAGINKEIQEARAAGDTDRINQLRGEKKQEQEILDASGAAWEAFVQKIRDEMHDLYELAAAGGGPTLGQMAQGGTTPVMGSFQHGGLQTEPGLYAMHGTRNRPELVLNPEQTQRALGSGGASRSFSLIVNFNGVNPNNTEAVTKAIDVAFRRMARGMPL